MVGYTATDTSLPFTVFFTLELKFGFFTVSLKTSLKEKLNFNFENRN